jgi:hypothetical protein
MLFFMLPSLIGAPTKSMNQLIVSPRNASGTSAVIIFCGMDVSHAACG